MESRPLLIHNLWMTTEPDNVFVAEQAGPPRRRYWIVRDGPATSNVQTRGWAFIYDEMGDDDWQPGWDTWEEFFFEILRYPPEYSTEALVWRNHATADIVDLALLQPHFDGKLAGPDQTPETAGLR